MQIALPRPRPWMLFPVAGAIGAGIAVVSRRRSRQDHLDSPADVGFMRAMHDAMRRDLDHLAQIAPTLEGAPRVPDGVEAGWRLFRDALLNHHTAEDQDLWPVLGAHLNDPRDRAELDAMVAEHHAIPRALDAVGDALERRAGVQGRVRELEHLVSEHLAHEERTVLPLLERHLTRREWRQFLLTERDRRSFRERADFIGWVLDDANDVDRDAVMAELPLPAHAVYRLVLRPRYVAQHRWQAA
jgi:iron-sulfur cluster repair protein YtfE (RIC family)